MPTIPGDESSALDRLRPDQLARLLDADLSRPAWNSADAAGALRQQLQAPLLPDLAQTPGAERARLERLVGQFAPRHSFGEQLAALQPHGELLTAIKHWARFVRTQSASPLQGEPATVLYFAAIAAAGVRLSQRITSLSDSDLQDGYQWASGYEGADSLTALFGEALRSLPPEGPLPPP